jgi:hypothetical protein
MLWLLLLLLVLLMLLWVLVLILVRWLSVALIVLVWLLVVSCLAMLSVTRFVVGMSASVEGGFRNQADHSVYNFSIQYLELAGGHLLSILIR